MPSRSAPQLRRFRNLIPIGHCLASYLLRRHNTLCIVAALIFRTEVGLDTPGGLRASGPRRSSPPALLRLESCLSGY